MAFNYWFPLAISVAIIAATLGIRLLIAEVFPYHLLRAQRNGKPTVTTKSYSGRTVLITGANGAYGSRAAKLFAHRDAATLVLVDVMDCNTLKQDIEAELRSEGKKTPQILVWTVDMMKYASCRDLARKVSDLASLDHVLMTAGILSFKRRESPEGWETCECTLKCLAQLPTAC